MLPEIWAGTIGDDRQLCVLSGKRATESFAFLHAEVLENGRITTVQLSEHMLAGRDTWLKWHHHYAQNLSPRLEQVGPDSP